MDAGTLRFETVLEAEGAGVFIEVPPELAARLEADPAARAAFERLSPTHRREYVEWVTGAKREETRRRRLDQALAMLRKGRHR